MQKSVSQIIVEYLERKGITKTKLGEMIGESRQNITKKLSKNDMDLNLVYKISIALEYDFLAEVSKQLPAHIRTQTVYKQDTELELALKKFIENNYPKVR
jgi:transcriptional regulator with XRE-family HTH domain